jgi:acetoin utilization deacetylase AcuC-like enzyme
MTPVFYDQRMNVAWLDSFSPSAGKPARFVELLQHHAFHAYGPNMLGKVEPVVLIDLCRVHSHDYVYGVINGAILNGFENNDPRVADSCLWTIGSLLSAARHAIKHPEVPVCSPTSGYHHAHWDSGGGFCTFNGLMVVAAKLIKENPGFKVAILDCDMHFGCGTENILKKFPGLAPHVLHITAGKHFYGDNQKQEALEFQAWLHESIEDINAFKPDLVLYQSGADPHVNDPLGGFLTTEELKQRDRTVFRGIHAPICWNLAGGYQRPKDGTIFTDPVLEIHHNTLRESDASIPSRKAHL